MLLIIFMAILIMTMMAYFTRVNSKFSRYGVKTITPLPIIGNMFSIITRQKHFADVMEEMYFKFPNESFIGRYEFMSPVVILRDLNLIKNIAIKDFENFIDHRGVIDEKLEPLFTRSLFSLKGQEWKDMRSALSPAFTISKMKLMVPFMDEVGNQMLKALERKIEAAGGHMDVNVKKITTRYATDVIASCVFGLKVNSYTDKNNIFFQMGKNVSTIKFKHIIIFLINASFPTLVKWLNLSIYTEADRKFFTNLVLDTMSEREVKKIIRPDMIHLLMQAKKGQLSHEDHSNSEVKEDSFSVVEESAMDKKTHLKVWTDNDLIAQAVLFFMGGFETVSASVCFCFHEIAQHPDIQERLTKEIQEFDAKNKGKLDYNSIQNMTYMDMVVSETLRLWPPVPALDRLCVKDYNLGKPHEKATSDYIICKGESLSIPVWAIHRNPQYFPDPEKFDPERFSEQNKHKINPGTYMPFGLGPRNCIGGRFGLYELKVMIYKILLRFEILPSDKLRKPVILTKGQFTLSFEGGHWVKLKIRN